MNFLSLSDGEKVTSVLAMPKEIKEVKDLSSISYDYHITRGITNNIIIEIFLLKNGLTNDYRTLQFF